MTNRDHTKKKRFCSQLFLYPAAAKNHCLNYFSLAHHSIHLTGIQHSLCTRNVLGARNEQKRRFSTPLGLSLVFLLEIYLRFMVQCSLIQMVFFLLGLN